MNELKWRVRLRNVVAIGAVAALASCLGSGSTAFGQDRTKEVIFARKILMDTIGRNMDELEAIAVQAEISAADVNHGKEHSDIVSVMLLAFPHLFPAASNEWKPNVELNPGTDTYAGPEVWTQSEDFYNRSSAAAKLAYDTSQVRTGNQYKSLIGQLRVACDSCHAVYYKYAKPQQ